MGKLSSFLYFTLVYLLLMPDVHFSLFGWGVGRGVCYDFLIKGLVIVTIGGWTPAAQFWSLKVVPGQNYLALKFPSFTLEVSLFFSFFFFF